MNWGKFKNWLGGKKPEPRATKDYDFKWVEVGPGNPFPMRILDIRPLTQTVIATTNDPAVAESYVRLRGSDGKDLICASIPQGRWIPGDLTFPHNGTSLHGIVFKAESMDVKWDIYFYDGCFLFARSWKGNLCYRARAQIRPDALLITEIECAEPEMEIARANVFFLLGSHAMRRILPHQLPRDVPEVPFVLATHSFSLFGNRACYATFEDITKIPLN